MIEFNYTGKDHLDALEYARQYNLSILNWIKGGISTTEAVLDFGAGKGIFCNELSEYNVFAVEPDRSMHEHIKCPVVTSLDEYDRNFNVIYSINVLEHIKDHGGIIRKFRDALYPGGKVKIFVPAFPLLYSSMDRLVGHYRRYSRGELTSLLINEGFDIVDIRYFDFAGFFVSLPYKLVNRSGAINPAQVRFYDRYLFPASRFMDVITGGRLLGKNIMIEARKSSGQ